MAAALPAGNGLVRRAESKSVQAPGVITGQPGSLSSVIYQTERGIGCRDATAAERSLVVSQTPREGLREIGSPRLQSDDGLHIVLRATAALDANPLAKAAFLRAAAAWEARIADSTTVIIDADFGPTWFGHDFPEGSLGVSNPQMLIAFNYYVPILLQLIYNASSSRRLRSIRLFHLIRCRPISGLRKTFWRRRRYSELSV